MIAAFGERLYRFPLRLNLARFPKIICIQQRNPFLPAARTPWFVAAEIFRCFPSNTIAPKRLAIALVSSEQSSAITITSATGSV